jgi:hypothetical protein
MCKKKKTCVRQSSIRPSPLQKTLIVKGLVLAIMVPLHLFMHAFVPPQLVHFHGFYMDGTKLYDTWTINGTNQCLHKKLASNFVIIFCFQLLFNKFNVEKHPIKVPNLQFVNFARFALPTWTVQSRHNVKVDDGTDMTPHPCVSFKFSFFPFLATHKGNYVLLLAKTFDQPIHHFTFSCNKQISRKESSFNG